MVSEPKSPVHAVTRVVAAAPGLDVDFMAVCDAVRRAWEGSGETITDIDARLRDTRSRFKRRGEFEALDPNRWSPINQVGGEWPGLDAEARPSSCTP